VLNSGQFTEPEEKKRIKKMTWQFEEKATMQKLEDYSNAGFFLHSCDQIKAESEKCLFYKVGSFNQVQEVIYNDAEYLTDGEAGLYVLPTISAGDMFIGLLLFGLIMFNLLKWIGNVMFRSLIDFKNRR